MSNGADKEFLGELDRMEKEKLTELKFIDSEIEKEIKKWNKIDRMLLIIGILVVSSLLTGAITALIFYLIG